VTLKEEQYYTLLVYIIKKLLKICKNEEYVKLYINDICIKCIYIYPIIICKSCNTYMHERCFLPILYSGKKCPHYYTKYYTKTMIVI